MKNNFIDNYDIFLKSQEFLNKFNICEFPVDILKVIRELNIYVFEFEEYKKIVGKTKIKNIKDGKTYLYIDDNGEETYLIIYKYREYNRWRFTLAHELAHILLGHFKYSEISSSNYDKFEKEADIFAGNFLAPPILIEERLNFYNFLYIRSTISNTFGISSSASSNCILDFKYWKDLNKESSEEIKLLNRCKKDMYVFYCNNCKSLSFGKTVVYCKICGQKLKNRFKRRDNVKYKPFVTTPICPICKNEELVPNSDFCHVCGLPLINKCMGDDCYESNSCKDAVLNGIPNNARYCPYCRSITLFFKENLLKPWEKEFNEANTIEFVEGDIPDFFN